ncbi:hypothetical protein [Macromonas bipunctata]|uniref:hypothetical protein n=1 Tax=Macromonas bipunctata TaxID=183670 RepID=UPI00147311F4|nr:hypothetical protein [Macromonas bipunctata]
MLEGTRELLKQSVQNLKKAIKSKSATLKTYQRQAEQVKAGTVGMEPEAQVRLVVKIKKLTAKCKELTYKLAKCSKRLAANVPGICFGSRKLFLKQ